ncbi:MAG: hypothetical protein ACR2P7_01180 [bacterium]
MKFIESKTRVGGVTRKRIVVGVLLVGVALLTTVARAQYEGMTDDESRRAHAEWAEREMERQRDAIRRMEANRPWARTGGDDCQKTRNAVYC